MSFTKLDSGIVDSSVWVQAHDAFRVWIYLLAKPDATGFVRVALPTLALHCMITLERATEIMDCFMAPDEHSRTETDDGRRIRSEPGGYQIINYELYRNRQDAAERREQQRQWDRDHRPSGHKRSGKLQSDTVRHSPTKVRQKSDTVRPVRHSPPQAEAEAEADKSKAGLTPSGHRSRADRGVPDRFDEFWKAYPRKVAKVEAIKAWNQLLKDGSVPVDAILLKLPQQIQQDDHWRRGFIPHPATYLRQRRWEDDITPPTQGDSREPSRTAKTLIALDQTRSQPRGLAGRLRR